MGTVIASFYYQVTLVSNWIEGEKIDENSQRIKGKVIMILIDETWDRKKGKNTEYVARPYLGSVCKVDKRIVSVNAYGIYENITFSLSFQVLNPKGH